MLTRLLIGLTAAVSITLGGCSTFNPKVDMPQQTTVQQPAPQVAMAQPTGSLYSPQTFRPLFEDQRARFVGDTLTIQVVEQLASEQTNSASASRNNTTSLTLPGLGFGIFDTNPVDKSATGSADFKGQGQSKAANTLTGTITVTVSEVLPNGNLRVVGEKQIGTNRDVEKLKFTGVVNPVTILPGNVVPSNRVADARIEYKGEGTIDAATTMGWLSRFFLSVLPF